MLQPSSGKQAERRLVALHPELSKLSRFLFSGARPTSLLSGICVKNFPFTFHFKPRLTIAPRPIPHPLPVSSIFDNASVVPSSSSSCYTVPQLNTSPPISCHSVHKLNTPHPTSCHLGPSLNTCHPGPRSGISNRPMEPRPWTMFKTTKSFIKKRYKPRFNRLSSPFILRFNWTSVHRSWYGLGTEQTPGWNLTDLANHNRGLNKLAFKTFR